MATIERRASKSGDITYRVKIRMLGSPPATATFTRKTDANTWAEDTAAAIRSGKYFKSVEAKRHTLGEMADRYIRDVVPNKKSQRDTKRQLEWWKDQIGNLTLADVTPALIAEKRDQLKAGETRLKTSRSPATVNRYLAALSHAFTIAIKDWGWVEDNPVLKVSKGREPRGRVRFLSDNERARVLKACKSRSDQLYTIVVVALSTGARQGEILNLRWRDVDLTRQMIILEETKNDERRAVPLHGLALELIREAKKARRIDTDLLFPASLNPKKPMAIQKPWEEALKDAEVEDFRFHDLRHSAASYMAMNGASIAEIAAVLGHKTLEMVKRYAHLSEQHTASVVARMNEKIFG